MNKGLFMCKYMTGWERRAQIITWLILKGDLFWHPSGNGRHRNLKDNFVSQIISVFLEEGQSNCNADSKINCFETFVIILKCNLADVKKIMSWKRSMSYHKIFGEEGCADTK
ncbi:unnamed protein product [Allacma fusca]|uniref:Uncharacterized protein n=1 Tax=Allacma fusca TaxID=39272 RepID=A0A8J2LB71_9HEXA|nr:unnamed protein product [Allacma fusca]